MSILSEILSSGHVEDDLLAALDDDQKQLLFCQMRSEQVRKWELAEADFEKNRPLNRKPKKKSLRWLQGDDGEVWVWVMGYHDLDQTIDEILENESREKAHALALRELRAGGSDSDEDALMAQLGRLQVGAQPHDNYDNLYNNQSTGTSPLLLFQPPRTTALPPPIVTTTTVSSYSTPQPQKAQLVRGERPPLMPKPTGYFATFSSNPQSTSNGAEHAPVTTNGTNHTWYPQQQNNGNAANGVRMRAPRVVDEERREEEVQKRESEIFQTLVEQRERLQKEAEIIEDRERTLWEEQEKKAREAENAQRELAQKAREKHQQMIRTSTSILPALKDHKAGSLREAIKNLPRPPKPKSRQAIIEWFQREELPRGTGLDPKTRAPAPWFHGIISREQSEVLLTNKPTGSFLVRVSERIWGYTVSYASRDGTFKHFLVEKITEGYQFLGTNQVVHDQLFDLVCYHETAPITAKGAEILKWAVGQSIRPPDYSDLIGDPYTSYNPYLTRSVVRNIPTTILSGPAGRF